MKRKNKVGIKGFDVQTASGNCLVSGHRKIFLKDETLIDLVARAGRNVINELSVEGSDIGLVIFGGAGSLDKWLWSPSAKLQYLLGLTSAFAFDVFNGCNSLQVCLKLAWESLSASSNYKYVLILIGDELSKVGTVDNPEHSPLWSFGDSACAAIIERDPKNMELISQSFVTDGKFFDDIWVESKSGITYLDVNDSNNFDLIKAYEKNYPEQIKNGLKLASLHEKDLIAVCMNQGSPRVIEKTEAALNLKPGTVIRTFEQFGHLGSTDVLLGLKHLLEDESRQVGKGSVVALASSSVGYSWGCSIIKV